MAGRRGTQTLAMLLGAMLATFVGAMDCTAQALAKFDRIVATSQTAQACIKRAAESGNYDLLKVHTSLTNPSLIDGEMVEDERFITPQELEQLKAWRTEISPCRRQLFEGVVSEAPDIQLFMINAEIKSTERYKELIEGKITWGQYNSQIVKWLPEFRAEYTSLLTPLAQAAKEERSALKAKGPSVGATIAQAAPVDKDAGKKAALTDTGRQIFSGLFQLAKLAVEIEAISAANRPVVTTCNSYRSTTTCVSH